MHRVILISSAALILAVSGVVHGLWTDRWTEPPDLSSAGERLKQVPLTVGSWQGSDLEMQDDATRLGLAGLITRRYVHQETGKVVTILLACGRPGPVCVHTPEACYGSSGYEVESPRRFPLGGDKAKDPPEFWTARFLRQRTDGQTNLRIYWSWHTSAGWRVADNPRLAFAPESQLHKLYVVRELANPNEPAETDACVDFLRDLLPAMQQSLFAEKT
jgi:Protein of unknown function (DUF3485)